ncbi:MAG: hypothetical protein M1409_10970, partial [Actinobacteria bacterium]|nr:hypothetical protein [Actinomycetota bacterium]
ILGSFFLQRSGGSNTFNYYFDSAGIIQGFLNILDPSIILVFSFMVIGIILLFSQKNKATIITASVVIGVMPDIKIYAAIIFYIALGVVSLIELVKNKNLSYFVILIMSGIVSAIVYLPINLGAGGLVFAPLLIFKNYIDSAWIFNNWHWNVNFPLYVESHNYIHLAFFYAVSISIFMITSLGIRLIVIKDFKKLFSRKFYSLLNIFWISMFVSAFIIPSFFVQTVSSFSIIQFFWVGYIVLLIPTAFVIGEIFRKQSIRIKIVLAIILVLLFSPGIIELFISYSVNPSTVSPGLIKQITIIKNIPLDEGVMVVDRTKTKNVYVDSYSSPIFSALSGHPIYYEHVNAFSGIDKILDERKRNIDMIADNVINCSSPEKSEAAVISIMHRTNNKYLLILQNNLCVKQFTKMKIINETQNSVLYKI